VGHSIILLEHGMEQQDEWIDIWEYSIGNVER
jgi:hypothetical protein